MNPFRAMPDKKESRIVTYIEYSDCRDARNVWTIVYFFTIIVVTFFSIEFISNSIANGIDYNWFISVLSSFYILTKATNKMICNANIVNSFYEQQSINSSGIVDEIPLD